MISALKELVNLFFDFDHHNYARWMPVFIQDLETFPKSVKTESEIRHFVINRSCHRSSCLPIDHAHEQMNKKLKGVGGVIGLTENPLMLERWIVAGPDLRHLKEFKMNSMNCHITRKVVRHSVDFSVMSEI